MNAKYLPYLLLVVSVGLAACSGKTVKKTGLGYEDDSLSSKSASAATDATNDEEGEDSVEASLRGKDYQPVPGLGLVYFDYDKYNLPPESHQVLAANVEWLKAHPAVEVRVAGHCDERGTVEYNIALGQRRANAVKNYYKMLGIAPNRIASISYGKEHPVCLESGESCWQKNRRGETLVRVSGAQK